MLPIWCCHLTAAYLNKVKSLLQLHNFILIKLTCSLKRRLAIFNHTSGFSLLTLVSLIFFFLDGLRVLADAVKVLAFRLIITLLSKEIFQIFSDLSILQLLQLESLGILLSQVVEEG